MKPRKVHLCLHSSSRGCCKSLKYTETESNMSHEQYFTLSFQSVPWSVPPFSSHTSRLPVYLTHCTPVCCSSIWIIRFITSNFLFLLDEIGPPMAACYLALENENHQSVKPHKNVDQYTVCGSFGPDLCVSFLQILFTNTPPSIPGHPISLFAPESIKLVSRGDRCDLSPCVCPIQMPVQWTRTSKDSEWSWHLQDCSSPRGFFHTLHVFFFALKG